jgi:hypothetical protein
VNQASNLGDGILSSEGEGMDTQLA